jgi:hypothetical protein
MLLVGADDAFVARINCDGQYFYLAVRLVLGNMRGN